MRKVISWFLLCLYCQMYSINNVISVSVSNNLSGRENVIPSSKNDAVQLGRRRESGTVRTGPVNAKALKAGFIFTLFV